MLRLTTGIRSEKRRLAIWALCESLLTQT